MITRDECNVPKDCYGCVYYDEGCPKIEAHKKQHPGAIAGIVWGGIAIFIIGVWVGVIWVSNKLISEVLTSLGF